MPVRDGVVVDTPVRYEVVVDMSVRDGVVVDTPVRHEVVVDMPIRDGIVVDTPVRDGVVVDTPVRDGVIVYNSNSNTITSALIHADFYTRTSASKDTDWNKCVICQEITGEVLNAQPIQSVV